MSGSFLGDSSAGPSVDRSGSGSPVHSSMHVLASVDLGEYNHFLNVLYPLIDPAKPEADPVSMPLETLSDFYLFLRAAETTAKDAEMTNTKLRALSAELIKSKQDLTAQVKELTAEKAASEKSAADLSVHRDVLLGQIKELSLFNKGLKAKNATLESDKSKLSSEKESAVTEAKKSVAKAEEENKRLGESIRSLAAENAALREQIAKLTADNAKVSATIQMHLAEKETMQAEVKKLSARLAALTAKNTAGKYVLALSRAQLAEYMLYGQEVLDRNCKELQARIAAIEADCQKQLIEKDSALEHYYAVGGLMYEESQGRVEELERRVAELTNVSKFISYSSEAAIERLQSQYDALNKRCEFLLNENKRLGNLASAVATRRQAAMSFGGISAPHFMTSSLHPVPSSVAGSKSVVSTTSLDVKTLLSPVAHTSASSVTGSASDATPLAPAGRAATVVLKKLSVSELFNNNQRGTGAKIA